MLTCSFLEACSWVVAISKCGDSLSLNASWEIINVQGMVEGFFTIAPLVTVWIQPYNCHWIAMVTHDYSLSESCNHLDVDFAQAVHNEQGMVWLLYTTRGPLSMGHGESGSPFCSTWAPCHIGWQESLTRFLVEELQVQQFGEGSQSAKCGIHNSYDSQN